MAYSYQNWTCNGAQTDFTFDFPYLDRTHIKVFLDGVETLAFAWLTARAVQVAPAPAVGVILQIRRVTPTSQRINSFTSSSIRDPQTFNNDSDQLLYLAQEAKDTADAAMILGESGHWDGKGKKIQDVSAGTEGGDATNLAQVQALVSGSGVVLNPGTPQRFTYVAGAGQTTFSIAPMAAIAAENCFVTVNKGAGAHVAEAADYSMNGAGDAVVFAAGLLAGDKVEIRVMTGQVVGIVPDDSITTAMLKDDCVVAAKIADGVVQTAHVADSAIITAKIADSAVTSAKIADGGILTADVAINAITADKITGGLPSVKTRQVVGAGTSYWFDKPALQSGTRPRLVVVVVRNDDGGQGKQLELQRSDDGVSFAPGAATKLPAGTGQDDTLTLWLQPGEYYKLVKTSGNGTGVAVREWVESDVGYD